MSESDKLFKRGAKVFHAQQNSDELQKRAVGRSSPQAFESYLTLKGMKDEVEEKLQHTDKNNPAYQNYVRQQENLSRDVADFENRYIRPEKTTLETISEAAGSGRITKAPMQKIGSIAKDVFENLFGNDATPTVPWLKKTFE